MADGGEAGTGPLLVEEGEWAGWSCWRGTDPFEDLIGPYYFREEADGRMRCVFRAEARHMNGGGFLHGGAVLAFIDYSLFIIARDALKSDPGVTVSLNAEFARSGQLGELIEATGEVTRAGGSLIFIRGQITSRGEIVTPFSGVIKRVRSGRWQA